MGFAISKRTVNQFEISLRAWHLQWQRALVPGGLFATFYWVSR
jgi:hypothetical protein